MISFKNKRPVIYLSVFTFVYTVWCCATPAVYADMPNEFEPDYADAIIQFQTNKHDQSLSILKELRLKLPKSTEVLELVALNYRANKDDKEAAKVYKELIDLKAKDGKSKKEIAPYAFELGMIRFNEKEYERAISFFQYSEKESFNLELSKFYLGNSYFNLKKDPIAKRYFEEVIELNFKDIKPAAHFYLGQIYFRNEKQNKGLNQLYLAKKSSENIIENNEISDSSKGIARQILISVETILKPIDKGQWFSNIALLAGFDSNVLLIPSDSASNTTSSGKSTLKGTLNAGIGYASSPLSRAQWIPNMRFSMNKNKNKDSESGEFRDLAAGLIYIRNPLDSFDFGGRMEANTLSQSGTGSFSKSIGLGPNYRFNIGENWMSGFEYYGKYTSYVSDSELTESQKRTGILHDFKFSFSDQRKRKYWNPSYSLKFDLSNSKGTEFKNKCFGGSFLNNQTFGAWTLSEGLDVNRTSYAQSSTNRNDTTLGVSLMSSKKLTQSISFLLSFDYSKNTSTDASSYSYNRFNVNSGLSLTL